MTKEDVIYLCLTIALMSGGVTLILYVLWPALAMMWFTALFGFWCFAFVTPNKKGRKDNGTFRDS